MRKINRMVIGQSYQHIMSSYLLYADFLYLITRIFRDICYFNEGNNNAPDDCGRLAE